MSVTITCPKCRAGLKANRMPPADQSIQCVRCKHRFTLADTAHIAKGPKAAPPETALKTAKPVLTAHPIKKSARGFQWQHGVVAGVVALLLVGAGVAGSWWLTQPSASTSTSVASSHPTAPVEPKPVAKAPAKVEPKTEPKVAVSPTIDPEKQKKFNSLMIAGGTARGLHKWDDALAAYADAQKLFPDDVDVQKNIDAVQKSQAEALKADADAAILKSEVAGLTKEAQQLLDRKRPADAVKLLETALTKLPDDPTATKMLADAQAAMQLIQPGDPKKVGEKFDTHILAGKAALKANQPADALREFRAAKELIPDDPLPPELIREAEKALTLVKNDPAPKKKSDYEAVMEKAKQLVMDKNYKGAEGAYQTALLLMPGDADATAGLAAVQQLMVAGKGDAKGLKEKADQALRNKQVDAAINLYKEALKLSPDDSELQRLVQSAITIQGNQAAYYAAVANGTQAMIDRRYGDAVIAFNAALSIAPGDPYVIGNLNTAQAALNQIAVMQQRYQNLTGLGQAALRAQQYGRALDLFRQAAASIAPPLSVDAATNQMALYAEAMLRATNAMSARRYQEAVTSFQNALRIAPGDPAATIGLRNAQQAMSAPQPKR